MVSSSDRLKRGREKIIESVKEDRMRSSERLDLPAVLGMAMTGGKSLRKKDEEEVRSSATRTDRSEGRMRIETSLIVS